jgi:hypothetical protein
VSPEQQYRERRAGWAARRDAEESAFGRLANVRLLLAVTAGVGAWWLGWPRGWMPLAGGALLFGVLMVWHLRIERRRELASRALSFYDRGLARLDGSWPGRGSSGGHFHDAHHVYAGDLDVFGTGSLFELLSTARTSEGEQVLANWLRAPAGPAPALARQDAVRELSARLDLRESLALLGEDARAELHAPSLEAWALRPPLAFPAGTRAAAALLTAASLIALLGWMAGAWTSTPVLAVALAVLTALFAFRGPIAAALASLHARAQDLQIARLLIERLLGEPFSSARLRHLADELRPAPGAIAGLQRIVEWQETGRNQLFLPVALLLLWPLHLALALERWRHTHGNGIAQWIRALAEWEALSSLASFAFEHPTHVFPVLSEELEFTATGLGHPLLPAAHCVANDVALNASCRLLVVSGSNMSGKSTLLRAVGLNAILAWAGAPVRATALTLGPVTIGASLRTVDSIQDGKSRFYAEITRLRQIADLSRGERPLLFLLDELLSGTNSHDRRAGAEAILRGLLARPTLGLITTHDLALTQIASTIGVAAHNVHFEDHLENGEMHFDYRMRPGVAQRSNALELMRSVGLLDLEGVKNSGPEASR